MIAEYSPEATDRPLPERIDNLAQLMRRAGFGKVESRNKEVHMPVASSKAFWDMEMSHGFRGFIKALPLMDQQEFKRRLMTELDRMTKQGGIILHRGAVFHRATKQA